MADPIGQDPDFLWMVFDSDYADPPGTVIASFWTQKEAIAHVHGPGRGFGWSVVSVPRPGARRPEGDVWCYPCLLDDHGGCLGVEGPCDCRNCP